MTEVLDEALTRFHRTGPEFDGWLSNHGPMAADALIRMEHADAVPRWVDWYSRRLEDLPQARWGLVEDDWRDALGDASRLGDWLALFARHLAEEPWQQLLGRWWPRLIPGAVGAATHPLIRTGHAVRALGDDVTAPRIAELGHALGYWAARFQALPGVAPAGNVDTGDVLSQLPRVPDEGGAPTRAAALGTAWTGIAARARAVRDPEEVPAALLALVDAAVARYAYWAPATRSGPGPVMLVHMATAPRAAALVLPALDRELWRITYNAAWATSAAIASMYRPAAGGSVPHSGDGSRRGGVGDSTAAASEAAARHGDEHVIKLTEVACESAVRGNPMALAAARAAAELIPR